MTEKTLNNYFECKISADALAADLKAQLARGLVQ